MDVQSRAFMEIARLENTVGWLGYSMLVYLCLALYCPIKTGHTCPFGRPWKAMYWALLAGRIKDELYVVTLETSPAALGMLLSASS